MKRSLKSIHRLHLGVLVLCGAMIALSSADAGPKVNRIEPPNWWPGMKWNRVQLMLYGEDLAGVNVRSSSPMLKVLKVHPLPNPSYAFVDISVNPKIPPGEYKLTLKSSHGATEVTFPILKRLDPKGRFQGFDQRDIFYLITPDRFADGDSSNNIVAGMRDGYNPDSILGRHGGDIQGIINHLDYLKELGVTALWMNPLIENNNDISYHGYIATDLYRIDPRFGTNQLYRQLVEKAHALGLKIILDHVSNHISINHPWMKNLPSATWLNGSPSIHERTLHIKSTAYDPHSDPFTKSNTTDGWFADYMPDLNQRDPLLAAYLIQNTLWWIESTGLDGIREDTYPYADQEFLAAWAAAILREYPKFNIVGEVWVNDASFIAPFQNGSKLRNLDSHLPAVTDFGLFDAFMKIFGSDRWNIGALHESIAKDNLYADPSNLVTFLDNHDVTRIMSICKGDVQRFTMALTLLLTTRGIPQILYGTELGMKGEGDHGIIRADFPGGFPSAMRNAFRPEGRTKDEIEIFSLVQQLIKLRRTHSSLGSGELIHFPPLGNIYAYLRRDKNETILCVANNNNEPRDFPLDIAARYLKNVSKLQNLLSQKELDLAGVTSLRIEGNRVECFEVIR